jgi:hypothetical protein
MGPLINCIVNKKLENILKYTGYHESMELIS